MRRSLRATETPQGFFSNASKLFPPKYGEEALRRLEVLRRDPESGPRPSIHCQLEGGLSSFWSGSFPAV